MKKAEGDCLCTLFPTLFVKLQSQKNFPNLLKALIVNLHSGEGYEY